MNDDASIVGVATNWNYPDYGGMLQALATQYALQDINCVPEVLDATALQGDINKRKLKYFAHNIFDVSIVKEKSAVVVSTARRRMPGRYAQGMRLRRSAFKSFSERHFNPSRRFTDWDDIAEATRSYKCVLVGSDQLWLPSNIVGDYYTLRFVPEEVRKVSYATSFGVSSVPPYLESQSAAFLKRFDALSAREVSGQEIIFQLTGRRVPLVCDPTLLVSPDRWSHLVSEKSVPVKPYVFCYLMGNNPYQREEIKDLSRKLGLTIVSLPHLDRYISQDEGFPDVALYDVSPADFLGLIANASIVCTDSFHGTIFSCLFHRDFFVFPRFVKKASLSTNTRIESLLTTLDLKSRYIGLEDTLLHHIGEPINYDNLDSVIDAFKAESIRYLKRAIGGLD